MKSAQIHSKSQAFSAAHAQRGGRGTSAGLDEAGPGSTIGSWRLKQAMGWFMGNLWGIYMGFIWDLLYFSQYDGMISELCELLSDVGKANARNLPWYGMVYDGSISADDQCWWYNIVQWWNICVCIYIYGLWGYGIVGLYVMDHGVISELLYNIGKPMP